MPYFITKYAISTGIIEVSESDFKPSGIDGIYGKQSKSHFHQGFHGKDWHETRAEAVARAEEMRIAKIASLKRSIAKLEKLDFSKES